MILYSWNVNGLRAAYKKGFLEWLYKSSPDILAVQETKCHPDQLLDELRNPQGYHTYWASAEKKGYSGVALFTKVKPKNVQIGLGIAEFDREGRTIVADYGDFVLLACYFPNGSRDHSRVDYKMAYKKDFLGICNDLRKDSRSVVFCGDVNTAHQEIDLARPKQNNKTTGFLPIEREWIDKVVSQGYMGSVPTIGCLRRLFCGAIIRLSFKAFQKNSLLCHRIGFIYWTIISKCFSAKTLLVA